MQCCVVSEWVDFLMAHEHSQAIQCHSRFQAIKYIQKIKWMPHKNPSKHINTTRKTPQSTSKQNYPGPVAFCNTRPGNKIGLFYSASEPSAEPSTWNTLTVCPSLEVELVVLSAADRQPTDRETLQLQGWVGWQLLLVTVIFSPQPAKYTAPGRQTRVIRLQWQNSNYR